MRILFVESPGLNDITTQDRRGEVLSQQAGLLRIDRVYQPIHTKDLLGPVCSQNSACDVIHLSAHGQQGNIAFTDGSAYSPLELQAAIWPYASGKIVVFDACDTHWIEPNEELSNFISKLSKGTVKPPLCVLTMVGKVFFPDSVLAWGVFYRHLAAQLRQRAVSTATLKEINQALKYVKGANLPKICAVYSSGKTWKNISPWGGMP
jgi:prepilin-type processing-associated H-X9-DG protein